MLSSTDDIATTEDLVRAARSLRARLQADPHRPRYHLIPPEGWFNDANGAIYHNGRYHLFYLARTPIPDAQEPGVERWVEVWDHVSSADLVHWVWHPPALEPATDGSTPLGIWSGGAVAGAPVPTLIYHVPGQGTCLASSDDPLLERWTPFAENPVIPITDTEEYVVFDPCAWREGDAYFALIGNKNRRPGHAGDCPSLFRSPDLRSWEYVGPFYRSRREWTHETEDAACPDFFSLGDRHMLLMHGHRPYFQCHYYLGRYDSGRFDPEEHGRMTWPGGAISGPETLLDDRGRRVFFGWIAEADSASGARDWRQAGWASVVSLPRILEAAAGGGLKITPAPELEQLRTNHVSVPAMPIAPTPPTAVGDYPPTAGRAGATGPAAAPVGATVASATAATVATVAEATPAVGPANLLPGVAGDSIEIDLTIDPAGATTAGVAVRCSPGGEEETLIYIDISRSLLVIDAARSSETPDIRYPAYAYGEMESIPEPDRYTTRQEALFSLAPNEPLRLRVFVDRSVVEVFANDRICMTQRVYPVRAESRGVRLLSTGASARLLRLDAWTMGPSAPW